jgi:hypothetical protein
MKFREALEKKEESADDRMCRASGCPNRWSVSIDGKLCQWHAFAEMIDWPRITREQIDNEAARIRKSVAPKQPQHQYTREEKKEILRKLPAAAKELKLETARLGWAYQLRARDEAGEALTPYQRTAWREALRRIE